MERREQSIYASSAAIFEGNERIQGRDAITAKVGAVQASFPPEFRFSPTGAPACAHDLGRLTWRIGPASAPPVATGMDIALFKNGRIQSLYVFLGEPADTDSRGEASEAVSK